MIFKSRKYKNRYSALNKRADLLVDGIGSIFSKYNFEAANIVALHNEYLNGDKEIDFGDPEINGQMDALITNFYRDARYTIASGVEKEWLNSEMLEGLIADEVFQRMQFTLNGRKTKFVAYNNSEALHQLMLRQSQGMNLSASVWNLSQSYKEGLEASLRLGIEKGIDAITLSKVISRYLADFESLRADYAEKYGVAANIHDCQYQAARLARTEINMAYRSAEQFRWNQLDFVLGYEIVLSNNHNCRGVPEGQFFDVCDELRGIYPKTFKFSGWHPNCRCHAEPILPTEEEMMHYLDSDMPDGFFDNRMVKDVPQNFKDWCKENEERIAGAKLRGTLPYFVRDNESAVATGLQQGMTYRQRREYNQERARIRRANRTPEEIERIKLFADEMQYSPEQRSMFREIEQNLGIQRGLSMSIDDADKSKSNPFYDLNSGYRNNCSAAASTYVFREWGFDVTAGRNTIFSRIHEFSDGGSLWYNLWENEDKSPINKSFYSINEWMEKRGLRAMTPLRYKEFFEDACKEEGTYYLSMVWKNSDDGHFTIIKRTDEGKLLYIEPQVDYSTREQFKNRDFDWLCENLKTRGLHNSRGIMRVDNKLFNLDYLSIFSTD